jgi:hypothetical protein
MAIPKGGFFKDKVQQGRYGPIFSKTPACYGFSIIAKLKPGGEEACYKPWGPLSGESAQIAQAANDANRTAHHRQEPGIEPTSTQAQGGVLEHARPKSGH